MLGKHMKCKVTGYEGIATSRVEYLNGCVQYCIKPKMLTDGKMPEGEYIDIQQLDVIGEGISLGADPTGGDMSDTPRGTYRG